MEVPRFDAPHPKDYAYVRPYERPIAETRQIRATGSLPIKALRNASTSNTSALTDPKRSQLLLRTRKLDSARGRTDPAAGNCVNPDEARGPAFRFSAFRFSAFSPFSLFAFRLPFFAFSLFASRRPAGTLVH